MAFFALIFSEDQKPTISTIRSIRRAQRNSFETKSSESREKKAPYEKCMIYIGKIYLNLNGFKQIEAVKLAQNMVNESLNEFFK